MFPDNAHYFILWVPQTRTDTQDRRVKHIPKEMYTEVGWNRKIRKTLRTQEEKCPLNPAVYTSHKS